MALTKQEWLELEKQAYELRKLASTQPIGQAPLTSAAA